jgi:hypothetical protein
MQTASVNLRDHNFEQLEWVGQGYEIRSIVMVFKREYRIYRKGDGYSLIGRYPSLVKALDRIEDLEFERETLDSYYRTR